MRRRGDASRIAETKDIERLIIELVRVRRAIKEMEDLRQCVEKCWNEATQGSHLVALHKLRCMMQDEARRGEE